MPNYYVIFRQGERNASDAAVNTKPTTSGEVLAPLLNGAIAKVSASSAAEAKAAARVAYPGQNDSTPLVVEEGNASE